MEETNSDCLICRQNVPHSSLKPDEDWPEILLRIFGKFCRIFQVKFPSDLKNWDFSKEAFPFCKSCRSQVVSLCKLQDQLELIQKSIDRISANLIVKLLGCGNADKSGDRKCEYFRNSIRRRYDVRVRLKALKTEEMGKVIVPGLMSMSGGKSGSSVKSHSSASSSDLTQSSLGLSFRKIDVTNRGVNLLNMTTDDKKDEGESLEGANMGQMKTYTRAQARSESPQPIRLTPLESITEPMDTDEDSVYDNGTDPLGFTNDDQQGLFEHGEASNSNAYVEIQPSHQIQQTFYDEAGTEDEPFQLPEVDVVLEEPEIDEEYLYPTPRHVPDVLSRSAPRARLPVTVLTPVGTLGSQGGNNSIWTPPTHVPKHANQVARPNTALRNFKNRKGVILVDEKTSTYSYAGFTFVKVDDRCVCNSCGASLKLRAQSDHHVNIRNHINSVHVEKKDSPQLPHLIPPPPILRPGQAAVINLE